MDAPDVSDAALHLCLGELDSINRWLGGYAVTLRGLEELLPVRAEPWRIVDVGCGGGDTLRAIAAWGERTGRTLELTGIDMQGGCLDYARRTCAGLDIEFVESDYRDVDRTWDVVASSLFCHHLSDQQLAEFLAWSHASADRGLVVNDLQRHPVAWLAIRSVLAVFGASPMVRHDGPLSVLRGFHATELQRALAASPWHADLNWQWAFRYRVIGRTAPNSSSIQDVS
jgi:2-polyprenyl-3-methyl-5-hydroxy-6-metoxy-1,4-benzoquinol methylase